MLELRRVSKHFGATPLLDVVSWQWPAIPDAGGAEVVALLGPSGSGKSTLLRIVAGLEDADAGDVLWNGQSIAAVPVERRGFALMFQQFALFPHLNVRDNVAFGWREQGLSRADARVQADAALTGVGLAGYGSRTVTGLSGGEQQRVALVRALVTQPRLLLLDEPFSALDADLRVTLRSAFLNDIRQAWDGQATTVRRVLLVTHDEAEARQMAHHAWRLHGGLLQPLW